MIIVIHGEDTYRSAQKLKELEDKFIADVDPQRLNLAKLSGNDCDIGLMSKSFQAAPFMARKRMVVVQNFLATKSKDKKLCEHVLELLKKHNQERNIIVFYEEQSLVSGRSKKKPAGLVGFLAEQKFIYPFPLLEGGQLSQWIQSQLQNKNITISSSALSQLCLMIGDNTWALHHELDKLVAYVTGCERTEITEDDVALLVTVQSNASIFALVDAIGSKQKKQALQLLQTIIDSGANDLYILSMITRQFRLLHLVKSASMRYQNHYDLAKAIGQNSFVVKKCLQQAPQFSNEQLRKIYNSLLEMDKKIKTSDKNIRTLFDLLVLSI